jgi:hypothetical protein
MYGLLTFIAVYFGDSPTFPSAISHPYSGSKSDVKKVVFCLLPASAGFLLGLHFNSEDGDDIFSSASVDFGRTTWGYIPKEKTLETRP